MTKKSIFLLKKCFKGARLTPGQSKQLVTGILLINKSLYKENLVLLFQTISLNISECPINMGETGKTAKKLTFLCKIAF